VVVIIAVKIIGPFDIHATQLMLSRGSGNFKILSYIKSGYRIQTHLSLLPYME